MKLVYLLAVLPFIGILFGAVFIFLLLAGEIYTTFLGGCGWAYGEGGLLSYGCLAYIMSCWLLPAVWRYAKRREQPDTSRRAP